MAYLCEFLLGVWQRAINNAKQLGRNHGDRVSDFVERPPKFLRRR